MGVKHINGIGFSGKVAKPSENTKERSFYTGGNAQGKEIVCVHQLQEA